ncbi:MAG: CBS domain-containing protein [Anaerolineae bacterium]|nr:CBS domain-containing protein [Anaerolineae bacterium]
MDRAQNLDTACFVPEGGTVWLSTMNVSDVMTKNPVTISPDATLREALETMGRVGCHHLPVISADKHLTGIITARDCRLALRLPDILREYWQDERLANHILVKAVMTPAPMIVEPDASADEAVRLMLVNYVSCLPVMRGETLVGIVTTSDLLLALMNLLRSHPPEDG